MGGAIKPGGLFAHAQSAAMGGYGRAPANAMIRIIAVLTGLLTHLSETGDPASRDFTPWAESYGHVG